MTATNTEDLRPLYDAACQAQFISTKGRSFEEWSERVSDDGLSLARQVLSVQLDRERTRLERAVISIAKRWAKSPNEGAHAQIAADNELRDAVTDLESLEAKQSK